MIRYSFAFFIPDECMYDASRPFGRHAEENDNPEFLAMQRQLSVLRYRHELVEAIWRNSTGRSLLAQWFERYSASLITIRNHSMASLVEYRASNLVLEYEAIYSKEQALERDFILGVKPAPIAEKPVIPQTMRMRLRKITR